MASIKPYQSKGKTLYRIQVYAGVDPLTGKKRYRSRQGIKTEHEARVIAAKLEYAADEGKDIKKPKLTTFAQVSDLYWSSYVLTVRKTTASNVQMLVNNHILPSLGNFRMAAITTNDLQKAVNKWHQEIPTETRRCLNYVRSVFKMAMREKIIANDPSLYVVLPRNQQVKEKDEFQFWNREQIAKFFICLDSDKDLEKVIAFKLLFYGGLRRGELLALTWSDIQSLDNNVLVNINKTLVGGKNVNPPKTAASFRQVPIEDAELVQMLKKWKQRQKVLLHEFSQKIKKDNEQLLFTTHANQALDLVTPNRWLSAIIDKNGLTPRINLHRTRHSFISNLLMAGVSVPVVQKLAGHSSPTTTLKIYSHINQQSKKDAAHILASYFKQASEDSEKDS